MNTLLKTIALGALAGTLMAQGPGGPARPRASATPPDPAQVAQREVARLTTFLTLTPAEVTQATTIFTTSLTAIAPLQTTLNTDRKTLQTAITTAGGSASIDGVAQNIGMLNGQIIALQAKADTAFYAILDATQQAKFASRGGLRGIGGFGGPGGPGFGRGGPRH